MSLVPSTVVTNCVKIPTCSDAGPKSCILKAEGARRWRRMRLTMGIRKHSEMDQGPKIASHSHPGGVGGMRRGSPLTVIFTLYNIPIAWWEGSLLSSPQADL